MLLAEKTAVKGVTSIGVKYEEMAEVGLVALLGSSACEDAKGESSAKRKLTLGRLLLERMGRSLRFFLTFFLNWWSSARSLERSSGRRSSLDEGTLRPAALATSESEVSESVNWRVSSKAAGSFSKMRGVRNRFEPGKGEEGSDKSFTMAWVEERNAVLILCLEIRTVCKKIPAVKDHSPLHPPSAKQHKESRPFSLHNLYSITLVFSTTLAVH